MSRRAPDDRYLLAPSFTWRPDEGTSVTLLGLFQKDNTASGQQLLPAVASLHASPGPRLPDSRFLGEPTYDTLKTEQGRARCCSTFFGHKSATGSGPTTPIDAYAPVYGNFVAPDLDRDPTLRQWQFGFYVQDQIRYADRVSLVLGARRDRAVADVQGSRQQVDNATSFRAGLIVDVGCGLSPYVSYSESFLPISGLDLFDRPFKPQRGYQYEAGVKWQPEPATVVTVAAFYIREKNRPTNDPANVLNLVQTGEVRSRGVEVDASWAVTRDLNLFGSYTFTDAEVTESGLAWEIGAPLESVPKHAASIWGVKTFRIADEVAVRLGLGLRYVGPTISTAETGKLTTPGYVLADALVAVDWQSWSLAINAVNLTDKRYYTVCRTFGDCFTGNRRTVVATLTRRF